MKASEKIREIAGVIEGIGGYEDSVREAWAVVSEVLGIKRAVLIRDDPEFGPGEAARLQEAVREIGRHKPLQYITGRAEFMGLVFKVGPGVLVPRPETEMLAREALGAVGSGGAGLRVLDLCTGSGCLAVYIAKCLSDAEVTGTDVSAGALAYARENARILGADNVEFLEGPLFGPVEGREFELIVSNPPYIRSADIEGLEPRVRDWEPREALDGGAEGTDYLKEIISLAPRFLAGGGAPNGKGGALVLETGPGQGEGLIAHALGAGLEDVAVTRDYAGHDRIFRARRARP